MSLLVAILPSFYFLVPLSPLLFSTSAGWPRAEYKLCAASWFLYRGYDCCTKVIWRNLNTKGVHQCRNFIHCFILFIILGFFFFFFSSYDYLCFLQMIKFWPSITNRFSFVYPKDYIGTLWIIGTFSTILHYVKEKCFRSFEWLLVSLKRGNPHNSVGSMYF